MDKWIEIDSLVSASKDYVLTEEEQRLVSDAEQEAFDNNLESIKSILDVMSYL